MNTVSTGIKAFACGAAALALTAVFSWSFVESTAVVRTFPAHAAVNVVDAAADYAGHVAQSTLTALVD